MSYRWGDRENEIINGQEPADHSGLANLILVNLPDHDRPGWDFEQDDLGRWWGKLQERRPWFIPVPANMCRCIRCRLGHKPDASPPEDPSGAGNFGDS